MKKSSSHRKQLEEYQNNDSPRPIRNFCSKFFPVSKRIIRFLKKHGLNLGIAIVLALILFHKPLLLSYGKWLSPTDSPPTADIALSLGGGHRAYTAAQLLSNGSVKALYIDAVDRPTFEDIVNRFKLPPKQVYWGSYWKNSYIPTTFDHAISFRDTMQRVGFPYKKIVIVSDRYHLRRCKLLFQYILGSSVEIKTYSAIHPLNGKWNRAMNGDPHWWWHKDSRDMVISETKKIPFYWIYYVLLGHNISWDVPG